MERGIYAASTFELKEVAEFDVCIREEVLMAQNGMLCAPLSVVQRIIRANNDGADCRRSSIRLRIKAVSSFEFRYKLVIIGLVISHSDPPFPSVLKKNTRNQFACVGTGFNSTSPASIGSVGLNESGTVTWVLPLAIWCIHGLLTFFVTLIFKL